MQRFKIHTSILIIFIFFWMASSITLAADRPYQPLAPLPQITDDPTLRPGTQTNDPSTLSNYFNNMYRLGVGIATALAVLMIIWGGVEYVSTDAIGAKEEGKERIGNAITGLLLALGSYLILKTIDQSLLSTDISMREVTVKTSDFKVPEEPKADLGSDGIPGPVGSDKDHDFIGPGQVVPLSGSEDPEVVGGVEAYRAKGSAGERFTATDGSNQTGSISPEIAYLRDFIPTYFSGLQPGSSYRSRLHNDKVGGSENSDHLRGKALDVFNSGPAATFSARGRQLVEWVITNGNAFSADQVIFEDLNYIKRGGQWIKGSSVGGHNDHVHIGLM